MGNNGCHNGVAMGNNDVIMSNNDLLVPEYRFARAVARACLHIGTLFGFMSFIANRREAAGMQHNRVTTLHGLSELAFQAGWWPWTTRPQRGLGAR